MFRELTYDGVDVGMIECTAPEPALRVFGPASSRRILAHKIAKHPDSFVAEPARKGCLAGQPTVECIKRLSVSDIDRQDDVADPAHESHCLGSDARAPTGRRQMRTRRRTAVMDVFAD